VGVGFGHSTEREKGKKCFCESANWKATEAGCWESEVEISVSFVKREGILLTEEGRGRKGGRGSHSSFPFVSCSAFESGDPVPIPIPIPGRRREEGENVASSARRRVPSLSLSLSSPFLSHTDSKINLKYKTISLVLYYSIKPDPDQIKKREKGKESDEGNAKEKTKQRTKQS